MEGTGFTEVGGILNGQIVGGATPSEIGIKITGVNELSGSGQSLASIAVSSIDIQRAIQNGPVAGWIHSQPRGTAPSINDENVSRFLSQFAGCPNHVVLITDRNGINITGYLFTEGEFRLLRGLKIRMSDAVDARVSDRVAMLHYTDV